MIVLIGIAVLVAGFALRVHPFAVIALAAASTGFAAHMTPLEMLAALGKAFNANRLVAVIYLVLPVVGLLERHGLQERAKRVIAGMRGATVGRLLAGYMLIRQATAALGLISIAGHPQTVRPLIAPMAEGAAETQCPLDEPDRVRLRALAAGTDNVAIFFGEDIFLAIGSILLMKGLLASYGIDVEPLAMSLWAMPIAVAAFAVHGLRLMRLDRRLRRGGRP